MGQDKADGRSGATGGKGDGFILSALASSVENESVPITKGGPIGRVRHQVPGEGRVAGTAAATCQFQVHGVALALEPVRRHGVLEGSQGRREGRRVQGRLQAVQQ